MAGYEHEGPEMADCEDGDPEMAPKPPDVRDAAAEPRRPSIATPAFAMSCT